MEISKSHLGRWLSEEMKVICWMNLRAALMLVLSMNLQRDLCWRRVWRCCLPPATYLVLGVADRIVVTRR
ncbi:MAG: hypothetical protein ACLRP3_03065 [Escherichia sp.]